MSLEYIIGTVLLHLCMLVGIASVVLHSRVRWYATQMGRHLMAYMSVMAAILLLSCIGADLRMLGMPISGWFEILRLVVFLALPVVMTQRLYLQVKARRTVRKAQKILTSEDGTTE